MHLLAASTMYITNCRIFLNCTVKNPHLFELAKLERKVGRVISVNSTNFLFCKYIFGLVQWNPFTWETIIITIGSLQAIIWSQQIPDQCRYAYADSYLQTVITQVPGQSSATGTVDYEMYNFWRWYVMRWLWYTNI